MGRADIPWPEVERRVAEENTRLAARSRGYAGECFVACTLYYTPMESGITGERGFDATLVSKPGLHGRKYPRDFLRLVIREGFGRLREPFQGHRYIRYNGENTFVFARQVVGRNGEVLVPKFSAAVRPFQPGLSPGKNIELLSAAIGDVFSNRRWRIADTGGRLRRWQLDLYWGEDEPLGPGKLMTRPRGTTFEYAISELKH